MIAAEVAVRKYCVLREREISDIEVFIKMRKNP